MDSTARAFLTVDSHMLILRSGRRDRHHDARHTATGAHVQYALARLQKLRQLPTIHHIAADEFLERRVTRQVHRLIARP